jgi:endo-beta-N-acetylglucosaminidase D
MVANMQEFLRTLCTLTRRHAPTGLVLWYDSVTATGALKWQNELNSQNKCGLHFPSVTTKGLFRRV